MNTRNVLRGLAFALSLGVALPAMAADLGAEDTLVVEDESIVTFTGGIGIVSLEANEYVYRNSTSDDRLSHLIWQSTAPMLTAGLGIALPEGWTLSANAQVAMGGDSNIEDYDWIDYDGDGGPFVVDYGADSWTHRSQHDATDLDWYFNGSILLGHDFAVSDALTVNLNGGFKYTDVRWTSHGGDFVYSLGGFRDTVFSLPDSVKGITYRQTFPALVAGLDAELVEGQWTLGASAQAGFTVFGKGDDTHFQTPAPNHFIDNLGSAPLLSVGASVGYEVAEGMNLFVAGKTEKIFTGRGDTDLYNRTTGALLGTAANSGGGDLFAASITGGIKGTF